MSAVAAAEPCHRYGSLFVAMREGQQVVVMRLIRDHGCLTQMFRNNFHNLESGAEFGGWGT